MRARFRRHRQQDGDLDITAFMNLMVILVPFLLITAVFNQTNILEMNLPEQADNAQAPDKPPEFALEVIIREDKLQVGDKPGRILKSFPMIEGQHDLAGVSALLQELKARFPEHTAATLLLEPDVPYEHLIQVMDAVRMFEQESAGQAIQVELFPDMAMGDAPKAKGAR